MTPFKENTEGVFFGLPEAIYRKAPGTSITALKPMAKSPKAYKYARENPKPRTAAMAFGSILHACLLETQEVVDNMIVTRPDKWDSFRSKEAREWRDQQTAIVVSKEELAEIHACADAVRKDPKCAWILERAQKEVAVFKRHERTGLLLKGKLDMPFMDLQGDTAICDIKKTVSVKKSLFASTIGEYLLHCQAAYYLDLLGASHFYFIAVEESAPYEVAIFKLGDESIRRGRELNERMLDKLAKCKAEDHWPGISEENDIQEIEAPAWC